jgi:protein-tyrosine phosphatase/membrane-associated phospholipid phosphatase
LLFVAVYGGTNWLAAQRPDSHIGTWYFTWELAVIPYVPWLIVPYMSIDLFFLAAPFLCRDERQRRAFAQRVVFAILVAAVFFVILPLKLAWPARPRVEGWFGDFVEASCAAPLLMEYPHNLFPSLHITLCVVLASLYVRYTQGHWRIAVGVWFVLIGCSAVLTYQHHLVDLLGGAALAGLCFYLFPEVPSARCKVKNLRLAGYYGLAAGILLALAWLTWPWGGMLIWPAGSLGLATLAYGGLGPRIYHKTAGRVPWSVRVVLGGLILGHYLSLLYYRRRCRPWDEVAPNLWMGARLRGAEANAVSGQVTAVLDLTAEFSEVPALRAVNYRNLQILDLTAPTLHQMHEAVRFIDQAIATGTVYVHCKIGYSRSAAVVGAYLLYSRQLTTTQEVINHLRRVRPSIVIRRETLAALRAFEESGFRCPSVGDAP